MTIKNDQVSYMKHGVAPMCVFFTLFGCWGGGGGAPKGAGAQPAYVVFQPRQLKNGITSQRLLDQSQVGVYRGKHHISPILGLFGPFRVP